MAVQGQVVADGFRPTHFPGLLGPMVAAVAVTAIDSGQHGVRTLLSRMVQWRIGRTGWLLVLMPVLLAAAAVGMAAVVGRPLPSAVVLARFDGLPAVGLVGVAALLILVNGFGEETGWRGYLQTQLEQHGSRTAATSIVAAVWAVWHLPLFAVVGNFRDFDPGTTIGFVLGLLAGAVVLTDVLRRTGGSILAVAVWHGLFNLVVASEGAPPWMAATLSTVVMIWAVALFLPGRSRGLRVRDAEGRSASSVGEAPVINTVLASGWVGRAGLQALDAHGAEPLEEHRVGRVDIDQRDPADRTDRQRPRPCQAARTAHLASPSPSPPMPASASAAAWPTSRRHR